MPVVYKTKLYADDIEPKVAARRAKRAEKYSSKGRDSGIPSIDMLLDRGMRLHLPEFRNAMELNELRMPYLS